MNPTQLRCTLVLAIAGLLCHDAAAQLAKRDAKGPPPAESLEIKNETSEPVRVDLLGPKGDAAEIACLAPGGSMRWPSVPSTTAKIGMQVFRGECMKPQVACQHAIPYAAGLRYAVLRGEGRKCGIFPMEPPPLLQSGASGNQMCGSSNAWTPVTFTNRYPDRAVLITITSVNRSSNLPDPTRAACWGPGVTRMACIDPGTVRLMAEVEEGTVCAPNLRVLCKTTMEQPIRPQNQMPPAGGFVEIRPNGANCYWTLPAYGRPPS